MLFEKCLLTLLLCDGAAQTLFLLTLVGLAVCDYSGLARESFKAVILLF